VEHDLFRKVFRERVSHILATRRFRTHWEHSAAFGLLSVEPTTTRPPLDKADFGPLWSLVAANARQRKRPAKSAGLSV
jgi:hypothetical protein